MRTGLAVLALIAAACLLAPLWARHVSGTDPFRTNVLGEIVDHGRIVPVLPEAPGGLGTAPIPPAWRGPYLLGPYLLGADGLGRDVAARLLYGGRTSLLLAAAATSLCLLLGTAAGTLAGVCRGRVDATASAALDLLWAFPVTLLAIALAAVLAGEDAGPWLPAVILGVVYAPYVARPVRAALLAMHGSLHIEAARATGGTTWHILRRHMLPGLAPLLLGLAPVVAAMTLLTEAALSILGVGVQPPGASWGTLIAEGAGLLHQRPVASIAPGLALSATVLALNAVAQSAMTRHAVTQGAEAARVDAAR